MPKIAVIFHRLGPYHCARLEAASKSATITAVELSSETREYGWNRIHSETSFRKVTLFPGGDSRGHSVAEIRSRVHCTLEELQPDVVAIPGWSDKGSLAGLQWCVRKGKPAILMSESCEHDEKRVRWKEIVKRRVVACCSSSLVGGAPHRKYLRTLGMSEAKVFTGYDVVDNAYFADAALRVRRDAEQVRSALSLPHSYFLASARFIEKKNLHRLLHAYGRYRAAAGGMAWGLVLLGDGPLRESLTSECHRLGISSHVLMPGFKQYHELPGYYALAGAFVHASTTEQWGLVVNEALASGTFAIVSNRCGCAPELIREGVNGATFDPLNVQQLSDLLKEVASGNFRPAADAHAAFMERFAPETFAAGLCAAAAAAQWYPAKTNWLNRCTLAALLR